MRAVVCAAVLALGLAARPALAQTDGTATKFWKSVQATCDASAAKSRNELGQHIAKAAIDEFNLFGGHRIDSNGRLFRFGLTEAEHEEDEGGDRPAALGKLGWWRVMLYWRALFGDDAPDKLEVRGYRDASVSKEETQQADVLRPSAGDLLRAVQGVTDPDAREVLRETALRGSIIDTPWSAAFISYVVRQGGVAPNTFQFSNAHRAYIYDAFATSIAEVSHQAGSQAYRACPLATTRPRPGDLICNQREASLADAKEETVRERIRGELAGPTDQRSIRRTHCEVVAFVDARARKIYTIGGNVDQSVTARKMNLRRDLRLSASQKSHCGGAASWAMPQNGEKTPEKCSLNDRNWFVLLQVR